MAKSTAAARYTNEEGLGGKIKSWPQRTKSFYTDVRMEMKKVTRPSMKEVRASTVVVIIAVALFGVFFFVVDTVIAFGINHLLAYFR